MTFAVGMFLFGAVVSLGASWLLVSRLERIGDRLGVSEAMLGLVAALAADAPEVTAAVTALMRGEHQVGAGVVVGSNVFNLAALLGLSALVAGAIALHRRVVLFAGGVAVWVAGVCLLAVTGAVAPGVALALALVAIVPYGAVLGTEGRGLERLGLPRSWARWLAAAVAEEEQELEGVADHHRGAPRDAIIAGLSLVLIVAGSVAMERAASMLGVRFGVPQIVVGGLVLAAVTSLPNAVAAVYLAARGRGAATLSTALNSNALNVLVGLLLPGTIVGLGAPSGDAILVAAWYAGLTVVALGLTYGDRGLRRDAGGLIVLGYIVFTGSLLAVVSDPALNPVLPVASGLVVGLAAIGRFATGHVVSRFKGRESLLPGWPAHRLWMLGIGTTALVAAADALLGNRVVLIGLLIVGPCCALLTGRWLPTALTAGLAIGFAVLLGLPDGIWASAVHLEFVGAVVTVALANIVAAAITERLRA